MAGSMGKRNGQGRAPQIVMLEYAVDVKGQGKEAQALQLFFNLVS